MPAPVEYICSIPRPGNDPLKLAFGSGESIVIVGANGSGKTRLGVLLEGQIPTNSVQRIAAQKSLSLNDKLNVISLERAQQLLRYGHADYGESQKLNSRWGGKPAIHFLSDFDGLLQVLFAKHNRLASKHLQERKITPDIPAPTTELERLKMVWDRLLPHRTLEVLEASIIVHSTLSSSTDAYSGSEMSDGERAIFYFLGQCFIAPENGVIIIDEPEAHIHKAILVPLWDAIEKARPDCSFLYITHDPDFAARHIASKKYFIRAYTHTPPQWSIEELPGDTGLPEQVVIELVGSRRPILFVEGDRNSIDSTIYQSLYAGFTIVPIGSCEAVIHSVASYKGSSVLHWLQVRGIVDADDRDANTIANLNALAVYVLPVAEVENLLLLPDVFLALADALSCSDPVGVLQKLIGDVMIQANNNLDLVSVRYSIRQLDRQLKNVEINAKDLLTLQSSYQANLAKIDPATLFGEFKARLQHEIQAQNMLGVLQLYDNKGLLALAASYLGLKDQKHLLDKVRRLLGSDDGAKIRDQLTKVLPKLSSQHI